MFLHTIIEVTSRLRSLYFYQYQCDIRFVSTAIELKETCARGIVAGTWDKEEIERRRRLFQKEADLYVSTDWKRIKLETIGKSKLNKWYVGTWEEDYQDNLQYFKRWNKE